MAPRDGVNQEAASDIVRESLGLTADDLGMNPADDAFDAPDLEGDTDIGGGLEDDNFDEPQQVQQQQQQHAPLEDDLIDRTAPAPAPKQQQQNQFPKMAEVRPDNKGNLIDRKTGQIVARAGSEARMYQKLHKTTQAYSGLQQSYNDVEGRLNKAVKIGTELYDRLKTIQSEQSDTAPQRFGLSSAEAIEAMNFAKEAKTNPVGTIQKLLTKAAASGIDLTSIGLSGGNFDPKSLMDLVRGEINTAMNPLKERSQRETQQEQQQREATERAEEATGTLNTFLKDNPEAREYLPVFQKIYEQPALQHMSLGEVWAKLQLNLMRKQQQSPASSQRPANRNNQKRPVPSGRRMAPGPGRNAELASVDTSYDDIVRGLLT